MTEGTTFLHKDKELEVEIKNSNSEMNIAGYADLFKSFLRAIGFNHVHEIVIKRYPDDDGVSSEEYVS